MVDGDAGFLRRLLAANDGTQALQSAVDHVAGALGCDVSWAGLSKDDYLVMGAHRGLASGEMASAWRLKIGDGIGGRAASERRPLSSNDYQRDSRRVPLMKRLIDNEGIAATLVVPLLAGDRLLGVLYAGHRMPHRWTSAERDWLVGIAQDLAVRLRQLDIDGQHKRLAQAHRHFSERAIEAMRSSAYLTRVLLDGYEVSGALDALAGTLGVRVELRHADGSLVRASGAVEGDPPSVVRSRALTGSSALTLFLKADRQFDTVDDAFADLVMGVAGLQVLRLRERENTTEQLKGELLDQLLSGRISDPDNLQRRLTLIGLNYAGGVVAVVGSREPMEGVPSVRFREVLRTTFQHCIIEERDGLLVVLIDLNGESEERVRELLEQSVRRENRGPSSLVAGLGRVSEELIDYSMSYDEARAACQVGRRDEGGGVVFSARELGLQGLVSLPYTHLSKMVHDTLGPLLESDASRGTHFVTTLQAYMKNDRHIPATAKALYVHYNTVRNRIARIEEMLSVDMRDVDARFRIETALRMHVVTTTVENG